MKTQELPAYTDDQVEKYFGLSVSRLRSAQRYGLVMSETSRLSMRNVRIWRANSVLRVFLADRFAQHAGLAFNVAAGAFSTARKLSWERAEETAFDHVVQLNSCIYVVNRLFIAVHYLDDDTKFLLGHITVDTDGRSAFEPGRREIVDVDAEFAPISSKLAFNPDPIVIEFKTTFEKSVRSLRRRA